VDGGSWEIDSLIIMFLQRVTSDPRSVDKAKPKKAQENKAIMKLAQELNMTTFSCPL